ncbi:MAG: endolytic transglycosylase MltG [Lachnospiraceae bacterium]|nr:endolytic transglycosylase MltG [Lachnospiraceae bacterium]
MASKKKNSAGSIGYIVTVMGAKGIIKILLTVLVIIFLIFLARTSYIFGYSIFNETAVNAESPRDILVEIPEGASTWEIGGILEKNGLIENRYIFMVQERFSSYHGQLEPGNYILSTGQTPSQMLKIIARADTENQPKQEDGGTGSS